MNSFYLVVWTASILSQVSRGRVWEKVPITSVSSNKAGMMEVIEELRTLNNNPQQQNRANDGALVTGYCRKKFICLMSLILCLLLSLEIMRVILVNGDTKELSKFFLDTAKKFIFVSRNMRGNSTRH